MTKIVDKHDLIAAKKTEKLVGAVLLSLGTLDIDCGFLDAKGLFRVSNFKAWFESLHNEATATIAQAKHQVANRPIELINAAFLRNSIIRDNITRLTSESNLAGQQYEMQVTELKKNGFDQVQIDYISPPIQPQLDAIAKNIDDLQNETLKIDKFLGDGPRYDLDLLAGTELAVLSDDEVVS